MKNYIIQLGNDEFFRSIFGLKISLTRLELTSKKVQGM